MTRLVVTGASGFIGRHVVQRALDRGWQVTGLIRSNPMRPLPDLARPVVGALEIATLIPLFRDADVVIHLAGTTRPISARELERVHVRGSREVATAARETGARLVHVSSVEAVGASLTEYGVVSRLHEDDPPTPS